MKRIIVLASLCYLLTACVSELPSNTEATSESYPVGKHFFINKLNGLWRGTGEFFPGSKASNCYSQVGIEFEITNGIATSTILIPGRMFKVPIGNDGTINFKYEKKAKRDKEIIFQGKLSTNGSGGTMTSGNCRGKWEVFQKIPAAELVRRAEKGSVSSQYQIGRMFYLDGNYTKAFDWYLKAAAQGYAKAQNALGGMFFRGLGGHKQNFATSFAWFKLSCDQGNFDARANMKLFTKKQTEEGEQTYNKLKKQYNFN